MPPLQPDELVFVRSAQTEVAEEVPHSVPRATIRVSHRRPAPEDGKGRAGRFAPRGADSDITP